MSLKQNMMKIETDKYITEYYRRFDVLLAVEELKKKIHQRGKKTPNGVIPYISLSKAELTIDEVFGK